MRLLLASWWLQFRLLSRSPFFMGMAILTPLAYGSIALMMAGGHMSARIMLGTGLMGAWSTTLFGAAEALFMQRFAGTLELMIGAPKSLVAPVLGFSAATVTLGVYSIMAVVVLGMSAGGVDIAEVRDPLGSTAAILVVVAALISMGTLLAGLCVLTRRAMEITNIMEYPVWLACGLVVPSAALWPPLSSLGQLFPLGWAMMAVDRAVAGANPWPIGAVAVGMAVLYVLAGMAVLHRVDLLARERGTLRLR